jgi:hypothetical protein
MVRYNKNKFNAIPQIVDGIRFDSTAEAEFYVSLKQDPSVHHVDCHVPVTLSAGLRFNVDFFVYRKDDFVEAIEVKGKETSEFKRMRKLFDAVHPLAPLKVFQKKGKKWVAI